MFCVVYLPHFALQAILRSRPELEDRPVTLIDGKEPKAAIVELTPAAREAGIVLGMTSTQALARCSTVAIETRSPAGEQSAQDTLLQCAYSFSPYIEGTAPGICTMEMKGLEVANKQEGTAPAASLEKWAVRIIESLAAFHLRTRIGLAATPDLALHAAHCAAPVLAISDPSEFLHQLPIEKIGAPPDIISILQKWGIRTAAQFVSLECNSLSERLGPEAVRWHDQISGKTQRPLQWIQPPESFEEAAEFATPIETLEPLLFRLRRFIEQLARRLESKYLVIASMNLTLTLESGDPYHRTFAVPAPTAHVDTLFRMLYTHLENLRTEAPISALCLRAEPCAAASHQFGLFESALRDPNSFSETIARVTALLSPERVGTPVLPSSHRPDDFRIEPVAFAHPSAVLATNGQEGIESTGFHESGGAKSECFGPALRKFRPRIAITVEQRERKPVYFSSAKFKGGITHSSGPWRSSGNWWEQGWSREEWDVQTEAGRLFRLVHDPMADQWWLEGIFD